MTADASNFSLPRGITEADVIDLVDGVLSREREALVLTALRQHPELGLLAKQFRADRSMVAGLGEVRAPGGMAEGIESRLEAAALRDLASQSREVPRPIPISQVQIREPSVLRLLLDSPWTRRLATAASLAIVVGLGAFAIRGVINSLPGKQLAHKDPAPNPAPEIAPPTPAPVVEIAVKPSDTTELTTPTVIAAIPEPTSEALTDAVAARLASEGRLAITVRATIAAPALKRLETLARARDNNWRAIPLDAPAQYALLMSPQVDAAPIKPTPSSPDPITIASSEPTKPAPVASPTSASPTFPALHPVVKAIYTVDLTPGEQPFEALIRSINDALPEGARVTLRVLPQPVAAPVAFDPDSVLWWTSPSGKWSKRSRVPVVIEGME
jgi:hypothetical protein